MTKRRILFRQQHRYLSFGYPSARRPCLFVELSTGEARTGPILALVDSGADRAQFHTDVATQLLGLRLADLERTISFTAGGPAIIYRATVTMRCSRLAFPAEVRFNPQLARSVALLGRADLSAHFLLGFDARNLVLLTAPYAPVRWSRAR